MCLLFGSFALALSLARAWFNAKFARRLVSPKLPKRWPIP